MSVVPISVTVFGIGAVVAGFMGWLSPIVSFIVNLLDIGKHFSGDAPRPGASAAPMSTGGATLGAALALTAVDALHHQVPPDHPTPDLHHPMPELHPVAYGVGDIGVDVPDLDPGHDW